MARPLAVMTLLLGAALSAHAAVDSPVTPEFVHVAPLPIDSGDTFVLDDPTVVSGGSICGMPVDGSSAIRVYKGIPYAAPPIGELRWKPPQPVAAWDGILGCVQFGPSCPQPSTYIGGDVGAQNEDCLYLNVWTPAHWRNAKLPVMVWIHGGGFATGTGSLPFYDGTQLASHGVVVVTINYRLGPFGYFAHPLLSAESPQQVSGNYGMLDQIEALRWVQRNIANFGGDPDCVTVFGESAGSSSISRLLVCPLAKGLFHRAIAESGGPHGYNRHLKDIANHMPSMESVGAKISKTLGCDQYADEIAALRSKSAGEILDASRPTFGMFGNGTYFGPVVDGWLLPEDPDELWAKGELNGVPLIVGSNADEGSLFIRHVPIKRLPVFKMALDKMFGDASANVLELYPTADDQQIPLSVADIITDTSFTMPARAMARAMSKAVAATYLYQFCKVSPRTQRLGLGATHASEIPYVFRRLDDQNDYDDSDRALGETISSMWVRFAATGDPNPLGADIWPRYDVDGDCGLEFGAEVKTAAHIRQKACDFFESLWLNRRNGARDPTSLQ